MKSKKLINQLFNLKSDKFVLLCRDLLNAEYDYDITYLETKYKEYRIDVLAKKDNTNIAIEVKHKFKIGQVQLKSFIDYFTRLIDSTDKFIFISSAEYENGDYKTFETDNVKIILQDELSILLEKHRSITEKYISILRKQKKFHITQITISLLIVIILSTFSSVIIIIDSRNNKPLTSRIENVEKALTSIKGLEKYLEEIKEDMRKTEIENLKIIAEYENIRELEDVIKDKKEILNSVLYYQPWHKKFQNIILGLAMGVFASIIGSICIGKWKLRKSLKN